MTMPAEVTSANDWDRLITELRTEYRQIDELYQRITAPEEGDEPDTTEETEPMAAPDGYPNRDYDIDADDRAAELEEAERVRLDAETDAELDGDYDPEPDDDTGLEV